MERLCYVLNLPINITPEEMAGQLDKLKAMIGNDTTDAANLPELLADQAEQIAALKTAVPDLAKYVPVGGSLIGINASGLAAPMTAAAWKAAGVAEEQADNSAGTASAINVRVKRGVNLLVNGKSFVLSGAWCANALELEKGEVKLVFGALDCKEV